MEIHAETYDFRVQAETLKVTTGWRIRDLLQVIEYVVELAGIELAASSLRTMASANFSF